MKEYYKIQVQRKNETEYVDDLGHRPQRYTDLKQALQDVKLLNKLGSLNKQIGVTYKLVRVMETSVSLICRCGHLVEDHADYNGGQHRSAAQVTGACGCVFNKTEAAQHLMEEAG